MYDLPTLIRTRRDELGISMEIAAVQIGTTRLTYHNWEKKNVTPAAKWVEPLAEWLDAPRWQVLNALGLLDDGAATFLGENYLGSYLFLTARAA